MKTKVTEMLEDKEILYSIKNWNGRISDELAKKVFKTVVLENRNKELFAFAIPVNKKLDYSKAARELKTSRLTFVDDLQEVTGMEKGACSILLLKNMKLVIDKSVLDLKSFYISSAKKDCSVQIFIDDLDKIGDFSFLEVAK